VEKRFQAVEDLIRQVETKAADEPDTLALVVALIKLVIRSEVDPYLLSGILIEGECGGGRGAMLACKMRQLRVCAADSRLHSSSGRSEHHGI
jgi:hypothetical protein